MIIKGVSDIRGIRGVNSRPGSSKESNAFLELYQLSTEKDHLLKKLQRVRWQKDQTEKRLSEIAHALFVIEKSRQSRSSTTLHSNLPSAFIEY